MLNDVQLLLHFVLFLVKTLGSVNWLEYVWMDTNKHWNILQSLYKTSTASYYTKIHIKVDQSHDLYSMWDIFIHTSFLVKLALSEESAVYSLRCCSPERLSESLKWMNRSLYIVSFSNCFLLLSSVVCNEVFEVFSQLLNFISRCQ